MTKCIGDMVYFLMVRSWPRAAAAEASGSLSCSTGTARGVRLASFTTWLCCIVRVENALNIAATDARNVCLTLLSLSFSDRRRMRRHRYTIYIYIYIYMCVCVWRLGLADADTTHV